MTTSILLTRHLAPLLIAGLAVSAAVAAAPSATGATAEAMGGTTLGNPSVIVGALQPSPVAARVVAPRSLWQWPVLPPRVLRVFVPPPTRWASGHRGVDLAAVPGGEVRAPAPGVVTYAGVLAGRGVLVVAHEGGLRSTLEPVMSDVPVGARVIGGQPVGRVADPAASPGSHCAAMGCVHWGVLRGETYLDPLALLRGPIVLLPL